MKRNRSSIVRPSVAVRVLLTVGIVWGLDCFPSVIADDIVVTGSAQADGLLSSLRLSFSAHAAPTRLFLAWGVENSGDSLGNWEHVDWLADVPAGATSCDAPVPTLHSGLPFVRIFRIAPDDSITELESVTATGTQYVKGEDRGPLRLHARRILQPGHLRRAQRHRSELPLPTDNRPWQRGSRLAFRLRPADQEQRRRSCGCKAVSRRGRLPRAED